MLNAYEIAFVDTLHQNLMPKDPKKRTVPPRQTVVVRAENPTQARVVFQATHTPQFRIVSVAEVLPQATPALLDALSTKYTGGQQKTRHVETSHDTDGRSGFLSYCSQQTAAA